MSISLLTSWMYVVGCERQPSEQAPSVEFSDPVQFEFRIVGEPQSVEDLARYAALIQRRLARSIPGGLRVTALETRGLLVEMERAAADDDHTQIALKVLSAPPPKLEFRIIANPEDEEAGLWDRYRSNLERDGPTLQAGDAHGWFEIGAPRSFFPINSPEEWAAFVPKDHSRSISARYGDKYYLLARLAPEFGLLHGTPPTWRAKSVLRHKGERGYHYVSFTLDEEGGRQMWGLSSRSIKRRMAILLDDVVIRAPTIESAIRDNVSITGEFSEHELAELVEMLESCCNPYRFEMVDPDVRP